MFKIHTLFYFCCVIFCSFFLEGTYFYVGIRCVKDDIDDSYQNLPIILWTLVSVARLFFGQRGILKLLEQKMWDFSVESGT